MENNIIIDKEFLAFRHQAREIEKAFLKQKKKGIILDFSLVKFFNRSFADEFLNVIEENRNKKISLVNLNSDLKKFLSIVKRTKEKIRRAISLAK